MCTVSIPPYFYPRSPCGERLVVTAFDFFKFRFLSTLSLRRATLNQVCITSTVKYFYPRSPCGERLAHFNYNVVAPNFYPRSPCGERLENKSILASICIISIHALLAESDSITCATSRVTRNFYPRSPCGERPVKLVTIALTLYFYPRSPCGERRPIIKHDLNNVNISIHALLAESDTSLLILALCHMISIHALLAESDLA